MITTRRFALRPLIADDSLEQMCLDNNIEVFRGNLTMVFDYEYFLKLS